MGGCFRRDIAICRETGDRHGEGQTLGNLGIVCGKLQRFDEAIACYQDALAILLETGDRHREGQTLGNLGTAYQELRQYDQAAICCRDAAAAMRDAGDHEQAALLEQLAANARPPWRRLRRKG